MARKLATFLALSLRALAANVTLDIPSSPPAGHLTVDGNYLSYSIEFSYMKDYAGNASHPNTFSSRLLQNLADISGSLPIIRAGGTTANRATYYPNQTEAVILTYNHGTWEDQPDAVSIGPKWHESFQQFPEGTQYIYNTNFYDYEGGLEQTVLEASAAWEALGESIIAFEIGNEVNSWGNTSRRPENFTLPVYIDEWNRAAAAIDANTSLPEPRFQGCAFTAPRDVTINSTVWNVANAVRGGLGEGGYLYSVADHDYMGVNDPENLPTLAGNLLNHFRMTSLMRYHQVLGDQLRALGVPYVIGETNSISRQGTPNVSDVFGAALWSIDYTLYAASLNISRMYFHMGTPYRYSAWQPIAINDTAAFAKPLYYGNMFVAEALAGGDKQVVNVLNTTDLVAYAIYGGEGLDAVAVVNLGEFNQTMEASERESAFFELGVGAEGAEVWRLTAPGVDAKMDITLAGQYVDAEGNIVGEKKVETVEDGVVAVAAGEAVLVKFAG